MMIDVPSRIWLCSIVALLFLTNCKESKKKAPEQPGKAVVETDTFSTPLGKVYQLSAPSPKLLDAYVKAKKTYEANPKDLDALIWYGRRTAYLGRYADAIDIYSKGIETFPNEPRLYRHRGHRFISIRQFDKAIVDLEKAGQLIAGTENKIEQDGMPNAQNIPVSTLHGNIWYHLGLAYYLVHDNEKAYTAYLNCRASGELPDNIVSSTHWLYMIQRRLGNLDMANEMLEPISDEMKVIENQSYYELCKLYKGMIPTDSLIQTTGSPSNDAVAYGLANWYFYNNKEEEAKKLMEQLVESPSWSSFGYIAAESDLIHYFQKADQ